MCESGSQRPTGSSASMPAASAIRASATLSSQRIGQVPVAVVGVEPCEQLNAITPSFIRLALKIGFVMGAGSGCWRSKFPVAYP